MKFGAAAVIALILVGWFDMAAASKTLDIYFIDVEGGQATLMVTPAGQSLLIDAGFPGFDNRDPKRIMAAIREAGLRRVDYLLITHFHIDHVGGVPELSKMVPIGRFIDYGAPVQTDDYVSEVFPPYARVREGQPRLTPRAGDKLPYLKGIDIDVVSAAGGTRT